MIVLGEETILKIITGGGGIDKDGNAYTLPEKEVEVPDDYFLAMAKAMAKLSAPGNGHVIVSQQFMDALEKARR
jgi:hypothetical protein